MRGLGDIQQTGADRLDGALVEARPGTGAPAAGHNPNAWATVQTAFAGRGGGLYSRPIVIHLR